MGQRAMFWTKTSQDIKEAVQQTVSKQRHQGLPGFRTSLDGMTSRAAAPDSLQRCVRPGSQSPNRPAIPKPAQNHRGTKPMRGTPERPPKMALSRTLRGAVATSFRAEGTPTEHRFQPQVPGNWWRPTLKRSVHGCVRRVSAGSGDGTWQGSGSC